MSKCSVCPATFRGFPCAPWTVRTLERLECPPLGVVAHHMANPRHVTEAPVFTSPKTGMPSMESWPEMGSATARPTGATLALGDPSVSLNAMGGH